jgi:hypothetical protein
LLNFGWFFPARQVSEIILNIPEKMKMPTLSGLGKRPQGILLDQSTRGFFDFGPSF